MEDAARKPARKRVREATPSYLEGVGLWYLERFGGTESRLRQVLEKRVRSSVRVHHTCPQEGAEYVAQVLQKLKGLGYVNDEAFATQRVETLRRRGKSVRMIAATLRHQGVGGELIDQLAVATEAQELAAARSVARKKRWRALEGEGLERKKLEAKRLAALARQGFSFDVAKQVLAELDA